MRSILHSPVVCEEEDGIMSGEFWILFPSLKLGNNTFDASCFARRCKQRQPQNMANITSDLRFGSNNREQNFSSTRQIRQNPVDCAGKKRYD